MGGSTSNTPEVDPIIPKYLRSAESYSGPMMSLGRGEGVTHAAEGDPSHLYRRDGSGQDTPENCGTLGEWGRIHPMPPKKVSHNFTHHDDSDQDPLEFCELQPTHGTPSRTPPQACQNMTPLGSGVVPSTHDDRGTGLRT